MLELIVGIAIDLVLSRKIDVCVAATPSHDGMRTPMRDRAWNPHTPMTPHRYIHTFLVDSC